jgi:hypothetical protein
VIEWVALICAAIPAVMFLRNLRVFHPPQEQDTSAAVSVLIPARNEEKNIASCIGAALSSGNVEVVVLDDSSTDRTAEMVAAEPRVRLIRGAELPHGWSGKNFACAQLAAAAKHPLLLFIDADVRLAPGAASVLAQSLGNADLLSGVPRQEVRTFSEQLLIPLIHFVLLGFLPLRWMRRSSHPAFGAACGQLMLIRRDAYEKSGGHGSIRGSTHDGVALPKAFRTAGCRTDLVDVTPLATCRMYGSNGDVWRGLMKNAHEGLGSPGRILPFTLLLFCGQVLPFVVLFTGTWIGAAAAVLALLPRLVAVRRFEQPLRGAVLHPLGVVALLGIQWAGLLRHLAGRPSRWRGREYSAGDRVAAADAAEQVPQRVQHAVH